jgi:Macrocin-O-methyltransferase (TylF)
MINKHFILTNPLTKRLYPLFLHFLDGQNIERKLQDLALEETARFVAANFDGVPAFKNDFELLRHAVQNARLDDDGLICEFGVYRGTTINFISGLTSKTVHGFDSFEGLPETWRPNFEKGRFRVAKLPQVRPNVKLYKGWFEDSLPGFLKASSQHTALLHVDCDLYSSTKTIFRLFRDRIRPGTVIVFDEFFNYPGWQDGEFKAFNELIAETGWKFEWLGYCCYHEQVAVIIK